MTRVVAVTGASGTIGRFVLPELQRHGWSVRALARPTTDRSGFAEPPMWISGTLLEPQSLRQLVHGAHAVVHLAYEHILGRFRGGEGNDLAGWLDANMQGTLNLLLAARDAGVKKFIFLSSRAVFSQTEAGRVLDETHPLSPNTHYGAYKMAVEAFLKSFASVEGMQTVSVRATGVYGIRSPLEKTKWFDIVSTTLRGEPIRTRRGGTEVHGSDVARTIVALLTQDAFATDVVHLSDLYVTHRQLVALVNELANRQVALPPPPQDPPTNMLVCRAIEPLGIELGGEPLLRQTIADLIVAIQRMGHQL